MPVAAPAELDSGHARARERAQTPSTAGLLRARHDLPAGQSIFSFG
jgi:hypothetical protein